MLANEIKDCSAPDAMRRFSKTESNIKHFYTNPNFLLTLWKDLDELFQKQLVVLKKSTFR